MNEHFDYLIAGGGLAAANALKELVKLTPRPKIGLIAEEPVPPYDRPPLSKAFLLGKVERRRLFLLAEDFFEANGVKLFLREKVSRIDNAARSVETGSGMTAGYEKLLLATGCNLRKLRIPGADLDGLYYLRTLADSESLKTAASQAKRVVMIGAGFIGLEVASVLAQLGLDVTVIHRGPRLLEKFDSDKISNFYEERFTDAGVHIIYGDEASQINGNGRVSGVSTVKGRTLPCDLAVAGIGVETALGFAQDSGLELQNGIVVDEYLRSSDPNVYAAGDVARFYDPIYGRQRRTEHWDNAIRQGKLAARNMSGAAEAYRSVSYFYSTMFDMTFHFLGDMSDYDDIVTRGSFESGSVGVLYLKEGILQAAFLQGRPGSERQAVTRLISEHRQLSPIQRLADDSFDLQEALAG